MRLTERMRALRGLKGKYQKLPISLSIGVFMEIGSKARKARSPITLRRSAPPLITVGDKT